MKSPFLRVLPVLLLSGAVIRAADAPAAPAGGLEAFPLDAYVALGSNFAQNARMADLGMSEAQFSAFLDGFRATFQGRPRPLDAEAIRLNETISRRLQSLAEQESRGRQAQFADPRQVEVYMKEAATKFKLQRSDSGLAYGLISAGTARPGPDDRVVVTFNAVAADLQTELPQLSAREQRFKVSDLLPGLAEGVQMIAAEGTALLVVPPDLSYADGEWPAGVARGPIIFTLKLHEIITDP